MKTKKPALSQYYLSPYLYIYLHYFYIQIGPSCTRAFHLEGSKTNSKTTQGDVSFISSFVLNN